MKKLSHVFTLFILTLIPLSLFAQDAQPTAVVEPANTARIRSDGEVPAPINLNVGFAANGEEWRSFIRYRTEDFLKVYNSANYEAIKLSIDVEAQYGKTIPIEVYFIPNSPEAPLTLDTYFNLEGELLDKISSSKIEGEGKLEVELHEFFKKAVFLQKLNPEHKFFTIMLKPFNTGGPKEDDQTTFKSSDTRLKFYE